MMWTVGSNVSSICLHHSAKETKTKRLKAAAGNRPFVSTRFSGRFSRAKISLVPANSTRRSPSRLLLQNPNQGLQPWRGHARSLRPAQRLTK